MKILSKIFIQFIELLFYGNFWIAFGALSLFLQTQSLATSRLLFGWQEGFIFSSTLFLYALHRIIGLKRVQKFTDKGRYLVIQRFRNHIILYAFLGGLAATFCFFQLPNFQKAIIVAPALLSIGYVIPVFGKERRLRDFNFLKIFLVAGVWAWVTTVVPLVGVPLASGMELFLIFAERFLFIFAITIPFDIRDLKVDNDGNVSTIPGKIGVRKSLYLSYLSLTAMIVISSFLFGSGVYPLGYYFGMLLSFVTTCWFIYLTPRQSHDYFFTGVMDGTMILQFLFILLFSGIL